MDCTDIWSTLKLLNCERLKFWEDALKIQKVLKIATRYTKSCSRIELTYTCSRLHRRCSKVLCFSAWSTNQWLGYGQRQPFTGVLYKSCSEEIFQISPENPCAFFVELHLKETSAKVFFYEFCEISSEHLFWRISASNCFCLMKYVLI